MSGPVRDATAMIAGMAPERRPGRFVFVTCQPGSEAALMPQAIGSFAEAEGMSLILPADFAAAAGFADAAPMACLTLTVWSALEAVGLTAAVARALAAERIPANVVAAHHHDHVFVPEAMADRALAALQALARTAADLPPAP